MCIRDRGSTQTRFDNIAKEGASVTIEELNYDDCVRLAAKEAAETPHGVIVQDTAWDGYEEIPSWIMQGYGSMAGEAAEQLREVEVNRPTHVFVPVSYTHLILFYCQWNAPDNNRKKVSSSLS